MVIQCVQIPSEIVLIIEFEYLFYIYCKFSKDKVTFKQIKYVTISFQIDGL